MVAWLTSLRSLLRRIVRRKEGPAPKLSARALEHLVGARVHNVKLYEQALTHRSMLRGQANSHLHSNERLEFLGDAVLGTVIAEHLYHYFPAQDEGFLTRVRSKLVSGQALARYAASIELGEQILMSTNTAQSRGRENPTILADAFEALIGALYLDLGADAARDFVERIMLQNVDLVELARQRRNYKSILLEYAQARSWAQPIYRVAHEEGPSHARLFTVEVLVDGQPHGQGTAGSKKKAEQLAARQALEGLAIEEIS